MEAMQYRKDVIMQDEVYKPAGFWRRSTAITIDGIILGLFLQLPLQFFLSSIFDATHMLQALTVTGGVMTVLSALYYVYFLSSRYQATPGKIIMKAYVLSTATGGRLTPTQALWRWVVFTGPGIIWMIAPIFGGGLPDFLPEEYKSSIQHVMEIQEKQSKGEAITSDDQQFLRNFTEKMMEGGKEVLSSKGFWAMQAMGLITGIYALMIACTVAFNAAKIGFHDALCKTRVVQGRAVNL